jgi:hypothetical protein
MRPNDGGIICNDVIWSCRKQTAAKAHACYLAAMGKTDGPHIGEIFKKSNLPN